MGNGIDGFLLGFDARSANVILSSIYRERIE
jgi:hypothetical protein